MEVNNLKEYFQNSISFSKSVKNYCNLSMELKFTFRLAPGNDIERTRAQATPCILYCHSNDIITRLDLGDECFAAIDRNFTLRYIISTSKQNSSLPKRKNMFICWNADNMHEKELCNCDLHCSYCVSYEWFSMCKWLGYKHEKYWWAAIPGKQGMFVIIYQK